MCKIVQDYSWLQQYMAMTDKRKWHPRRPRAVPSDRSADANYGERSTVIKRFTAPSILGLMGERKERRSTCAHWSSPE